MSVLGLTTNVKNKKNSSWPKAQTKPTNIVQTRSYQNIQKLKFSLT